MTTTVNTINGNEGNNRLTGTSRNDVINGNGGNDKLSGGSGADTLNGGAGKDELNGGSGNDILDGGSGSDELEGGSGNDTLIYTLAENNIVGKFTYDEYEGGSGTDTLELRFTRAEWMNTSNQAVLQRYVDWASKSGSSCRWDDDFTFKFSNARLEIEDIEKLVVKVDGTTIENVEKNTVIAVMDSIGISEDNTGEEIDVLDNDLVNYLVKDLKLERAPLLGTVTLIKPTLQNGSIDENANNWYFKYSPDNAYQYLRADQSAIESFTYKVTDAKGASAIGTVNINITGLNDEAVITFATPDQLIEDSNFDPTNIAVGSSSEVNKLISNGIIYIADIDKSESVLKRIDPFINNLGDIDSVSLTQKDPISGEFIRSDVRYLYTIENSKVQFLGEGKTHTDSFYVRSIDGTSETISFTTVGVNDKTVVKELGQGENKYAGSANVQELINLDHFKSTPAINTDIKYEAKYDFDHVRTGQFTFSDADLTDAFTITSKAAGPEGNLGTLTFDDYTNAKDSSGNIINGEYIVKWTYTVKDSDLDSLNTPTTGISSKDDDFIVTINDGTTTVDTKIMLNLSGRDEIEFVDGINNGNKVYEGTDESDSLTVFWNDVLYLGNGNDFLLSKPFTLQVAYGENGKDNLTVNSLNTVLFGGDGDDRLNLDSFNLNGLFFGGNGNDTFTYGFESSLGRKTYAWGGADSDSFFLMFRKTSRSIDWIMDFDSRKPIDGGDKIYFNSGIPDFNWDESTTELEKKSADNEHPFLSEGAEYYELKIDTSTISNDPNGLTVFNLVGVDGTEITLQGLIDNKNLV